MLKYWSHCKVLLILASMQTTASQHQQSKLSSSVVRTLMKTGAIHVELVYICFYSNDGEILKSSHPCPPSAADPKGWSGTVQGIQVITCSLSWSLAFSKCSVLQTRTAEKHESVWLCLFYCCVIYFPFLCIALKRKHGDLMIINFQGSRRREVYNVVTLTLKTSCLTRRPWT